MSILDTLERGRTAFGRRAWGDAFTELSAADEQEPLRPVDLDLLATAAYLVGRDEIADDLSARAYRECRDSDPSRAARRAFWLGFQLILRGEEARGNGWLARAERALDKGRRECAERGYLLVVPALWHIDQGDTDAAHASFEEVLRIGERFGDPDLIAFGRLGLGQALILLDRVTQGVASLDEAMVAVTADETSPMAAGIVYCAVLGECQKIFDLRRAQEWTAALARWCDSQPELVPYRGHCLVHRAEIMRMRGAWPEAMDEARRAAELLSRPPGHPAVGTAFYQLAELHRLEGDFEQSEQAYRQADRWGYQPQPGLALLRLAQGLVEPAATAIRTALDGATDRAARAGLLAAYVEIMLAAGDSPAASDAANELGKIAAHFDAPLLRAVTAHARGSVLLTEGDGRAAFDTLRAAWSAWQALDAPYDAARARVLVALAYRGLGDEDRAEIELDAARWIFRHLGARPDLARVDSLSRRRPEPPTRGALTARETEVLRLVAAGMTNRAIATELFLSEKTVARHLSNIFGKLGLSSRSAATAFAYRQGLVQIPE